MGRGHVSDIVHDFEVKLAFSKGQRGRTDMDSIAAILPGCVDVRPASVELDKRGVDYIATLRRGAEVLIDVKTREAGCSRFWRTKEPEGAIEVWSVIPEKGSAGQVGWTLDEGKITDMVLYVWDAQDCGDVYLLGFQTLRIATRRFLNEWLKEYDAKPQNSGRWKSFAVFVPMSAIQAAMRECERFSTD